MQTFVLGETTVKADFDCGREEAQRYIDYVVGALGRSSSDIVTLNLQLSGGEVDIDYSLKGRKFERIRRITGYLVGTVDRLNNAKQAELRDRVKHGLGSADVTKTEAA